MQIHLDSFGASLRVKDGMFWVKPLRHAGKCFAPNRVRSITITKGIHISSNALLLAIRHGVPVLFVNGIGHLEGMVWQGQYGSTATIRKGQLAYAQSVEGLMWCIKGLVEKSAAQRRFLGELRERASEMEVADAGALLERAVVVIGEQEERLARLYEEGRPTVRDEEGLRGVEGTAARVYFQCLSATLPVAFRFERRSRRPAVDPFSALLNYGYGVLYANIYVSLIKAGLDPHIGMMHADGHRRPALVYDMIEPYRVWVDRVAWSLCHEGRVSLDEFEARSEVEGLWLTTTAKRAMIQALDAYLSEAVIYRGRQVKRLTVLDLVAQELAQICKQIV